MTILVHYQLADGIATIKLDDDKRNALSVEMLRQIYAALDRAEKDRAIVILTGRDEVFSAGFDLKTLRGSPGSALKMLGSGFSLTARVLSYPYPVIVACNGHSMAMGVFLMLCGDYIIGSRGDFRVSANEVAIGLPMPRSAAATLQNRLKPAAYQSAVNLARSFTVDEALEAGFFDEVVEPASLDTRALELAQECAQLDMPAHKLSKRRIRRSLIRRIRFSVPLDLLDALRIGIKAALGRS